MKKTVLGKTAVVPILTDSRSERFLQILPTIRNERAEITMSDIYRRVAISLASVTAFLGLSGEVVEAGQLYAFAQQKVYNMSMQVGTPSNLTNGSLSIATTTAATLNGIGTGSNLPAMDAQQSYLGSGPVPPQNYSTTTPYAAAGSNSTVMAQAVNYPTTPGTPWGSANSTVNGVPISSDLPATGSFTRSDVLTRIPPPSNFGIDPNWLFTPGFQGAPPIVPPSDANISMDSVAEAFSSNDYNLGSANSSWTISGGFTLTSADTVKLVFNYINRLISFDSATSGMSGVSDANVDFSLDIRSVATGQSVFGGTPPSYASLLSHTYPPINGSETRNTNTAGLTSSLGTVQFVSPLLQSGAYSFAIAGNSRVNIAMIPEPSSFALLTLGGIAMVSGHIYRKRRK